MSVETHLLYAVHGPIVAALLVSLLLHCFKTMEEKYMDLKVENMTIGLLF